MTFEIITVNKNTKENRVEKNQTSKSENSK